MNLTYQSGLLQTLAYLMGERTVNSTTSTPRSDFIQKTLEEAYSSYPWKFARTTATLAISSGLATLPTTYDNAQPINVTYFNSSNNELKLDEIDLDDKAMVSDGDLAFWVSTDGSGRFFVNTKDTAPTNLIVNHQVVAPTLDTAGTIGTPYPNAMTLALGARRFVKLSQNPDADISQDQAIFEKYLKSDIAAEQIPHARKRRKSRQSLTGRSTGDF